MLPQTFYPAKDTDDSLMGKKLKNTKPTQIFKVSKFKEIDYLYFSDFIQ